MANLITTDTELTSIADAIRAKTGGSAELEYPTEFVSEIGGITTLAEGTADADAAAGDIRSGKSAYVNGVKVNGSAQEKEAETFYTSTEDRTIPAGKILAGVQTIKGVTVGSTLVAENIKAGVHVRVGDTGDLNRLVSLDGSFTSDANATTDDIKSGKSGYVNGSKINGTILDGTGVLF